MRASRRVSFDGQAVDFDRRAGLPAAAARQIAGALSELLPSRGVLLDLGAGTGQIGEHLARTVPRTGSVYVAIDLSAPMLSVFRSKLVSGIPGAPALDKIRGALVRADAATPWPIAGGSIDLVFSSRAAHLLPPEMLVRELSRVARPEEAVAVFGGVRSDPDSLRAVLRREMRRLLAEEGVLARQAGESRRRLAAALEEVGWETLPARTVASWPVVHRGSDSLAAWRAKPGLGGQAVPPELQERVLRRLEDWIRQHHGGLDVECPATERYELAVVRRPRRSITDTTTGGET